MEEPPPRPVAQPGPLGVSTDNLAGLSADELHGNKTAIMMMLHYYRELTAKNTSLQNDINTANSYVDAYKRHRMRSTIAAYLFFLSNLLVGFGVNLLTSGTTWPGIVTLVPGAAVGIVAIVLNVRE